MTETRLVASEYGPMVAFANDIITDQLLRYGAHAGSELGMLLQLLRSGDTVVDIGAHIGTFAIPMGRAVGAAGRVICFEPSAESHALLDMNIELNGLSATMLTRAMAVGAEEAQWRTVTAQANNTGATFLEPSTDPDATPSITLAAWLARNADIEDLHLLKVDTEGMELHVLQGAAGTLASRQPLVYAEIAPDQLARFEASPAAIQSLLGELGYTFYRNAGRRHGRTAEIDLVRIESLAFDGLFDVIAVPSRHADRIEALMGDPR